MGRGLINGTEIAFSLIKVYIVTLTDFATNIQSSITKGKE